MLTTFIVAQIRLILLRPCSSFSYPSSSSTFKGRESRPCFSFSESNQIPRSLRVLLLRISGGNQCPCTTCISTTVSLVASNTRTTGFTGALLLHILTVKKFHYLCS